MFNLETTLENGWPALALMLFVVAILVFLRFGVPYLIKRLQRKRPISKN